MPRKNIPGYFFTATQVLNYLANPKQSASANANESRPSEANWEKAQARLIKAHLKGKINLIGRKVDVGDFYAKPGPFERIPNQYFAHDAVLGDSLIARPSPVGVPIIREIWHEVKMKRSEFEAEFKSESTEAALRKWWMETWKRDGRPPTEKDAYWQFAVRQNPKLPRPWVAMHLKTLPKDWRRVAPSIELHRARLKAAKARKS